MSIFFSTALLCLLLALVVFLYLQYQIQLRKAQGKQPAVGVSLSSRPKPVEASQEDTRWKAVRVRVGLISCKASERLDGQVFLVSEAPQLPLAGCKKTGCQCRYVHLNDRRDGNERRESIEFMKNPYLQYNEDRRKLKDRRKQK